MCRTSHPEDLGVNTQGPLCTWERTVQEIEPPDGTHDYSPLRLRVESRTNDGTLGSLSVPDPTTGTVIKYPTGTSLPTGTV